MLGVTQYGTMGNAGSMRIPENHCLIRGHALDADALRCLMAKMPVSVTWMAWSGLVVDMASYTVT